MASAVIAMRVKQPGKPAEQEPEQSDSNVAIAERMLSAIAAKDATALAAVISELQKIDEEQDANE